jgi:glycosyltransferase involved in cell wall biosynthesis
MRLTLLSFYSGRVERGVEVYAQELKQRLSPRYQVEIISTSTQKALARLEANPPDILYPLNNRWQSILCKLFCLRHKTKLILGGHSGLGWDDKLNLWLFPDVFICFTHAQEQWAKSVNPWANTVVIPHGVDTNKFMPHGPKAILNLPRPIFVTVAKNVAYTTRAVSQLKTGSLFVLQDIPHSQIDQYYRAADVFVMTSSPAEAFGIAYLEAMACNLPVVATDDPIRREIIGDAGLFVADPHTNYSQVLKQVLAVKWGDKPRRQAVKFSWDKIIPQYLKLFSRHKKLFS